MSFLTKPIGQMAFAITLPTRLDSAVATTFHTTIQDVLGRSPRQLQLDCREVEYIDSTGLGLLTLARSEAGRIGCQVSLVDVPRPGVVADVLTLVHFDHLFPITFTEVH